MSGWLSEMLAQYDESRSGDPWKLETPKPPMEIATHDPPMGGGPARGANMCRLAEEGETYLPSIHGSNQRTDDPLSLIPWDAMNSWGGMCMEPGSSLPDATAGAEPGLAGEDIPSRILEDNAVGNYLMAQMKRDKMWGHVDRDGARTCSATVHRRVEMAVKAVYGEDSEEYRRVHSALAQRVMQGLYGDAFDPETEARVRESYPLSDLEGKISSEQLKDMGFLAAIAYSGAGGTFMRRSKNRDEDPIWKRGELKPGAILGLNQHTGIFVEYIRTRNGAITGLKYWDDTDEIRTFEFNDLTSRVRPTKAWNWD